MTFAIPTLPAFEVDFTALIASVEAHVNDSRALKRQPPIMGENGSPTILFGQEALPHFTSAPAIWVVPKGIKVKSVRRIADTENDPTPYFSQWILFECHCWGNDGPDSAPQSYSFSTCTELARQLIVAFVEAAVGGQVARGEAHTTVSDAEFRQRTDVNRQGRMLVFTLAQEAFIVRDESIQIAPATPTVPGLQISMTTSIGEPPPGTSTPAGGPILVPTGPNG